MRMFFCSLLSDLPATKGTSHTHTLRGNIASRRISPLIDWNCLHGNANNFEWKICDINDQTNNFCEQQRQRKTKRIKRWAYADAGRTNRVRVRVRVCRSTSSSRGEEEDNHRNMHKYSFVAIQEFRSRSRFFNFYSMSSICFHSLEKFLRYIGEKQIFISIAILQKRCVRDYLKGNSPLSWCQICFHFSH